MPGFKYHFTTFDPKDHLISAIFVNKNYLTLRIKDPFDLEGAFNYPSLLQYKGFKLVTFYSKDSIHINKHSEIHPAVESYWDIFGSILGMDSSFVKIHYHFQCMDNQGNELEITPDRFNQILDRFKSYQNNRELREQMKQYALKRSAKEQAPQEKMLELKRISTQIKLFPDEEMEKVSSLFWRDFCQAVSTSALSADSKSFPEQKTKICSYYDLSQPFLAPVEALPAPNSTYELTSGHAYSIVAIVATVGLFYIGRKCKQKPENTPVVTDTEAVARNSNSVNEKY
jgi:hypothetical protein